MSEGVLLYVEDEDAAAFLLETALKQVGIRAEVYRVCDGEQGIAFLLRSGVYKDAPRPDVVLLDLNLPRKNGFEVLEEIGKDADLQQIPKVMFTSSSLAADRERSLALGAREYITKPATFEKFVEAVRRACSYLPRDDGAERPT